MSLKVNGHNAENKAQQTKMPTLQMEPELAVCHWWNLKQASRRNRKQRLAFPSQSQRHRERQNALKQPLASVK
jgi:hypothetical protein